MRSENEEPRSLSGKRVRADELLVQRGLVDSRSRARAIILSGKVRSQTRVIDKAGYLLQPDAELEIVQPPRFVSRGGDKLDHALTAFGLDVTGMVCADFGASTGGFTDVLLQRGARRVFAVDVGYGQLDYRLRTDDRVVVIDRTNVRYLHELPAPVDLVTVDVSFISLALVLPSAMRVLKPDGSCVALIKPQFEAGKERVGKGGVVRDPSVHRDVIRQVLECAEDIGFTVRGLTTSPITGPAGNVEFLARFDRSTESGSPVDQLIDDLFSAERSGAYDG
jgi:23S rRNA (cytidine1920-2'-O)/16S rRNA (cytidine1409-2'-O)-methyltransferase